MDEKSEDMQYENIRLAHFLNKWIAQYPEKDKPDLIGRLSKRISFHDAFFELYIFALFSSFGFIVEIHPDIANTSRHPDFLISQGDYSFLLETKVDYNSSQKDRARMNQTERLKNRISEMRNPGIGLILREFEVQESAEHEPSVKELISEISANAGMHSRNYRKDEQDLFRNSTEEYWYRKRGLMASYSFFSLPSSLAGNSKIAIIDVSFGATSVDYQRTLLEALKEKAKGYYTEGTPYMIAVYELCSLVDDHGVFRATLGSETLSLFLNEKLEPVYHELYRELDGFFTEKPRNNVGAVMVFGSRLDLTIAPQYWLFINECADEQIRYDKLPFAYYLVNGEARHSSQKMAPSEEFRNNHERRLSILSLC